MAPGVVAENVRATLYAKLVEEEECRAVVIDGDPATVADSASAASEVTTKQKHRELVRAAGRAALEESLLSGPSGVKRKASEMTSAGIADQWNAYAEVYGTNGMAAGGARSTLVDPMVPLADAPAPSDAGVPVDSAQPAPEALPEVHASRGLAIWDF